MSRLVVTNIETQNIKFDSDTTAFTIGSDGGSNVKMANTSTYVSDGGAVTQNTVQGLAKVFCCNNGSGTIYSSQSMNVSGTTDNGSADITITYANPFASAYHTWGWTGGYDGGNSDASCRKRETTSDTHNLRYITCYAGTLYEWVEQSSTMHGDLA